MSMPELKKIHPKSRKAWRQWLEKNHERAAGVWLIYYKTTTGKRAMSWSEAVDEALCFGWIDSLAKKLDDERAMQKFTPRKARGNWSAINKRKVKMLIEEGQMTEAGLKAIVLAKKNGSWNTLKTSDFHTGNNSLPADLKKAFEKNKKALVNFENFAPSYRKRFFSWIDSAKRNETRQSRINHTINMAAANKKPGAKGFIL
jgi:uncharacterized protein YdeI (YjbR/CyaY-like superfamily)